MNRRRKVSMPNCQPSHVARFGIGHLANSSAGTAWIALIALCSWLTVSCAMSYSWDRSAQSARHAIALGDLTGAEQYAKQALADAADLPKNDPRKISLLELEAHVKSLAGRHGEAIRILETALERRETNADSHLICSTLMQLADAESKIGRPDKAIEYLDQILEMDEREALTYPAWAGLAHGRKAKLLAGTDRWQEALDEFSSAATILRESGLTIRYQKLQRANVKLLREHGLTETADSIEASFRTAKGHYLWGVLVLDPRNHFWDIRYVSRWRRDQMPLRIHIASLESSSFADPDAAIQTVKAAVLAWENSVEEGVPSFKFVSEKGDADIPIGWVRRFENISTLGVTQRDYAPTGSNFKVDGLRIATRPVLDLGEPLEVLASVVTHEMGHALGLFGHSPNPIDVMYPSTHEIGMPISSSDLATIRRLYSYGPATQLQCLEVVSRCTRAGWQY